MNAERAAAVRFLAEHSHSGWALPGEGAMGVFSGVGSAVLNGVVTTRPDVERGELERLAEPFAGLPSAPWGLQFGDNPTERDAEFARHLGLERSVNVSTMTCDLRTRHLELGRRTRRPAVRSVRPHDAEAFSNLASDAFDLPLSHAAQFASLEILTAPEVTAVWAHDRTSRPVALGFSITASPTHTALLGVGTLRSKRGKGFGSAVIAALLSDALERNSRTAFVQVRPARERPFTRLGFHVAESLSYFV